MNSTSSIITIGREFGSGGREFGRRLAEELDRRLLNISELNVMIRNFWNTLPMTAESAKSCLSIMMKNQPIVFCILL